MHEYVSVCVCVCVCVFALHSAHLPAPLARPHTHTQKSPFRLLRRLSVPLFGGHVRKVFARFPQGSLHGQSARFSVLRCCLMSVTRMLFRWHYCCRTGNIRGDTHLAQEKAGGHRRRGHCTLSRLRDSEVRTCAKRRETEGEKTAKEKGGVAVSCRPPPPLWHGRSAHIHKHTGR